MKSILRFALILSFSICFATAHGQVVEITAISSTPVDCRQENGTHDNGTITVSVNDISETYVYQWTRVGGGEGSITTSNTEHTFTNLLGGSYFVIVSLESDENNNDIESISVGRPPLLTTSITPSPAETCPNVGLPLDGQPNGGNAGVYTHLWTGTGAVSLDNDAIVNPTFTNGTPTDYSLTYTVTDSKSCVADETITLTVYNQPVANAGSDDEVCGLEYTLSATPSYGDGLWTATGPGGAVFDDNTKPNANVTVDTYGSYTFTWTEINGVCSDSDNVIIGFFEPASVDAGGTYEACTGSGVALNGSIGGSAVSATWTGGLGSFSDPTDLNATYFPHNNEAGTDVTLTLTTNDPPGVCSPQSDNATVTVYEQPLADAGTDGNSCSFNFTLGANPSVGTGTWTQSSGPGTSTFDNDNDPASGVTVTVYGTYVFTWTEENGICTDSDDVTVNFYEQPIADAGSDDATCGLTIGLGAAPTVGTGTWTQIAGPGTAAFNNDNDANTNVTVDLYGQYTFQWEEVNGTCSDADVVTINFFEQPSADAGTDGNSCSFNFTLGANPSVGTGTWTQSSGPGASTFDNDNDPATGVTVTVYGTYVFTWTEVNGICTDSDDVTVNFYEQPIADAGTDDATCGLTIGLGAIPTVGIGTWTQIAGPGTAAFNNDNDANTNVTVDLYGQYTFQWEEVNGTCSDADVVTIDFFEQPNSNAGPNDNTCSLSITLAAVPSAGTGTWSQVSGPGVSTFDDVNDPNTNVTVDNYGQYEFRWTEVDGICSDQDEVLIDFYEQPVADAGTDEQTCGVSYTLAANPSVGNGTWTLSGGPGGATFDNDSDPSSGVTVTAYGVYTFTWTEVNGTCAPSDDDVIVEFLEQPVADAGSDDATCGLTIGLGANPSVGTGTWSQTSGPGTASFVNSNDANTNVTVDAYGQYVFRWTEVNGICNDFNEITVDFNEQPIADAGTDGNSCSFNFTLGANPSVGTGTWTQSSGPGISTFDNDNDPASGVTVTVYGTYVFTWTEVNGICTDSDDVTVNFYEQPAADAGSDDATCGLTIGLGANPSVGTGTWTQIAGPGTAAFDNDNDANTNVTVDLYGQYTFQWEEVNGTCSDADVVTIDFFEQPAADAGAGGTGCGLDFNLNANASVGTGTWTSTGPGTASFSPSENDPGATVTVTAYGDYTFTWTEVNGICTSDDAVNVSFFEQPVADAGADDENCGLVATLSATPSVGVGEWTLSSGPAGATFDDTSNPNSDVTVDDYGTYTFRWTEVNNVCTDFDEVIIDFYETPTADAGLDADACGFSYALNANPSLGNGEWTYTGPGTAVFDDNTDPNTNVTVDVLGLYTFTWTETNAICTDADDVNVNFYEIDIAVDKTNAQCHGESNGTIEITATGGVGNYVYSIYGSGGPYIGTNVFNVSAGTYFIWVIDDNGCMEEYPNNPVVITEPDQINFDWEVKNITSCYGASDGRIIISNVTGGNAPYEYSIMEPPVWGSEMEFENLPGGPGHEYYIRVKDSNGCIVEANNGNPITINQPDEIVFDVTSVDVTGCWYNENGEISVTNVSGGSGTKFVSINDTDVWFEVFFPTYVITFPDLGVGDHTIRVRDRNNNPDACEVTEVVTITGPPEIIVNSIDLIHNQCFGDTNGEIDADVTGGTGSLRYSLYLESAPIAVDQPTGLFQNLEAGNYELIINDDNDCELVEAITITEPDELLLSTDITDINCSFSGDEGIIEAMATGGTAPYTITLYLAGVEEDSFIGVNEGDWVSFSNLAGANDYEVIVYDDNHPTCNPVSSGNLTVVVPDVLEFNPVEFNVNNLDCYDVPTGIITVAAQGGTAPYTFTLFDDGGNPVGDPIVTNDTDPVQFTDLPAGTYIVELNDDNSCGPVAHGPFDVTQPDPIVIDIQEAFPVSCFGDANGEVNVVALDGTGDLYYTITQGGAPVAGFPTQINSGNFSPLAPGTYVVEVTDDNGCGPVYSNDLTVNEPDPLSVDITETHPVCYGDNGSFQTLASNGTAPYEYVLETSLGVPVQTLTGDVGEWVEFTSLPADSYVLTITDDSGCDITEIVSITQPEEVDVTITFSEDPTCDPGDGSSVPGIIIAEATGGNGDYIYYIFRNSTLLTDNTTGVFDALSAGDYYVEVFDTNGCGPATTATITLNSPTSLEIDDILVTHVLCYGAPTGELEVLVSGQTGTVEYSLNAVDWQTENTFDGLLAGDHIVYVRDDDNCVISQVATINQEPEMILTVNETPPTTSLDNDGEIEVIIAGGSPDYTYILEIWNSSTSVWDPKDSFGPTSDLQYIFDNDITVGLYRITVEDNYGCIVSQEVPIDQFTIQLSGTDISCHGVCDGTITVSADGGSIQDLDWEYNGAPYDMTTHWDEDSQMYLDLCPGIYTLTATDTESNESTDFVEITQPDAIDVVSHTVVLPDCYTTQPEGIVIFDIQGGTPFAGGYEITWDEGNESFTGFVVDELPEGTYNFVIYDANGCEYVVDPIDIVYPEGMEVSNLHIYEPLCNSETTGQISVQVEGGTPDIQYSLDGPVSFTNTNGIFTQLPSGVYDLEIEDANGCRVFFEDGTDVLRIVLDEPAPISITTSLPDVIEPLECHYHTYDEVRVVVSGGTPSYTYQWNTGQQTQDLYEVEPGDYTITITDNNNCKASLDIEIPGPRPFDPTFTLNEAKCRLAPEGNDGAINITDIDGGNGDFTIGPANDFDVEWYRTGFGQLSNSDGIWEVNDLQSGLYYAVVTDAKACEDTIYFDLPFNEDNRFTVGIESLENYCFDEQATLNAVPIQGSIGSNASYEWFNITEDENEVLSTSSTFTSSELKGDTRVRVDVISSIGCLEQAETTLNVYPEIGPFIDRQSHDFFSEEDLATFNNDSTVVSLLVDTQYPVEMLTKNPDYELTYYWDPDDFFSPSNEKQSVLEFNTGEFEHLLTGALENEQTGANEKYVLITGMAVSEYGCSESFELKARILDRIKTSNVFTPNNDGINDIWQVPYINQFPNLEVKVYNRWGAVVWAAGSGDASKGWNGKNSNGKDLPAGTYYYVISFNVEGSNKWRPISGSVTIVR